MHKLTDLLPKEPCLQKYKDRNVISIDFETELGKITKKITFKYPSGDINISYTINWDKESIGSLRLGNITLMPDAFNISELCYIIGNINEPLNKFYLNKNFNHGSSVSSLVSATSGFGLPGGKLRIDDGSKYIDFSFNPQSTFGLYQITNQKLDKNNFTRIGLSCREYDDTSKPSSINKSLFKYFFWKIYLK